MREKTGYYDKNGKAIRDGDDWRGDWWLDDIEILVGADD